MEQLLQIRGRPFTASPVYEVEPMTPIKSQRRYDTATPITCGKTIQRFNAFFYYFKYCIVVL